MKDLWSLSYPLSLRDQHLIFYVTICHQTH